MLTSLWETCLFDSLVTVLVSIFCEGQVHAMRVTRDDIVAVSVMLPDSITGSTLIKCLTVVYKHIILTSQSRDGVTQLVSGGREL